MTISLALTDLITEVPSPERDEVLAGVQRYLNSIAVIRHRRFTFAFVGGPLARQREQDSRRMV